jgi:hypothetical protein
MALDQECVILKEQKNAVNYRKTINILKKLTKNLSILERNQQKTRTIHVSTSKNNTTTLYSLHLLFFRKEVIFDVDEKQ